MTTFISTFGKSARSAAVAAALGVVMAGSAMAATCDAVASYANAIYNFNSYKCSSTATSGGNAPAPICSVTASYLTTQCCQDPSATAGTVSACLCAQFSTYPQMSTAFNQAGLNLATVCP